MDMIPSSLVEVTLQCWSTIQWLPGKHIESADNVVNSLPGISLPIALGKSQKTLQKIAKKALK